MLFTNRPPAQFLGKIRVLPQLPDRLTGLEDLAYNVWWAWNPSARALFRQIHEPTWASSVGNPILFMNSIPQEVLEKASHDSTIQKLYDEVMDQFNEYMSGKNSWYAKSKRENRKELIAYFSAEYGIHESIPIYSGGLGVLAGDHLKSASDTGLPFIAVGLLYREGYFIQDIDSNGQQQALFKAYDWNNLPVQAVKNDKDEQIIINVDLPGRKVFARVWKVQVGRVPLYLMDTDFDMNDGDDRKITSRLYGGGQEMRIQQEYLLGIGGVRMLRALDYEPSIFHMNEGHSVFLGLERLREFIHDHGLSFRDAHEIVRSTTLFTTHTPVPAGNDAFPPPQMERYFRPFWESLGISRAKFMSLGLDTMPDGSQLFSLTVLALNLAAMANGVSELHGHVSRSMWRHVWADIPADENPIRHITNGVHTRTWLSIDMQELFDKYFPKDWRERPEDPELWENIDKIPDSELWQVIGKLRLDMIDFIHKRLSKQHTRFGESPDQVKVWARVLDPDALTIGFARRFATYKRATLIFRDRERLARILNDKERPVQIVFAGKAHPADAPGQALIKEIQQVSRDPQFHGKIVFIENYDVNVGRRLTSGSDVWLNNPRRPYEASGTSGMKVPLNGGINCSILDGWWVEAFRQNQMSGWALGGPVEYDDLEAQDAADAESIYSTIENDIAPLFYHRDDNGIPVEWLKRVRESMKTVAPQFSTNRMIEDYYNMFYSSGSAKMELLTANRYERARKNAEWKESLRALWPSIRIHARVEQNGAENTVLRVREKVDVTAEVHLGTIDPADVQVEIYVAPLNQNCAGNNFQGGVIPMHPEESLGDGTHIYRGSLLEGNSGEYGYTVRVVPKHPDLVHPNEMGLMKWAEQ